MLPSISARLESFLGLICGFLLWAISATLTVLLLISLGDGTPLGKALLGTIAIVLEGAKILSWRKGGRARAFAFVLIGLSAIASIGSALVIVEKSKTTALSISYKDLRSSPFYLAKTEELHSINMEVSALISRLQALPPDYVSASLKIQASLASLRNQKAAILADLAKAEKGVEVSSNNENMVVLMGRTIGIKPDYVLLFLLLFISACIEAGALILTKPEVLNRDAAKNAIEPSAEPRANETPSFNRSPVLPPSYTPPIAEDEFLEAAKLGSDLPFLHGRDKTAEILGISYADAKRIVGKLIKDGKIVVEGKRLRLTQNDIQGTVVPLS